MIGSVIFLTKHPTFCCGEVWQWDSSKHDISKIHQEYKSLFFNRNVRTKMNFKTLKLFLGIVNKKEVILSV